MVDGYARQAQVFRALAHPVRLRILAILSRQEACVCHLTAALNQRQPYISQQLATLRESGLVADRREGTLVYYRLVDEHLAVVLSEGRALVAELAGQEPEFSFPAEKLPDCPCPRCQQ